MKKHKKPLCIDFDRVLSCHGNNGAKEFLSELSLNYEIYIIAPRSPESIKKWFIQNDLAKYIKDITDKKIPACTYIDDNGIKYTNCHFCNDRPFLLLTTPFISHRAF